LLLHLGMSGSLLILPDSTARETHDHFDMELDSRWTMRFNDPRRFGSLHYGTGVPEAHRLLRNLAPEPLEPGFDTDYLYAATRKRRVAIKQAIEQRAGGGVGNIYASEALFRRRSGPVARRGR
jgi:formamidopyrimidine-DNA glycosylase